MNINTKVTSAIHEKGEYLTVDLFFNNPHVDRFILNIIKKEIILEMHIDKPCPHTRDFSHELGHA